MANSARIDELQRRFAENPRRYFAPLANEYRKNGNLEQAILICQEYLPQQPGHMSGHIVYGQTLYEAGRFAEARAVFETALALDPENLIALHHLGDIARELGDVEAARSWYRRVLETDPRNDEIIQLLAQLESASPSSSAAPVVDALASAAAVETPNVGSYEPTSVPPIPTAPTRADELLGFEPTAMPSPDAPETVDAEPPEDTAAHQASATGADDVDTFELVSVVGEAQGAASDGSASDAEPEAESWSESAAESSPEEEISLASHVVDVPAEAPTAEALDAELFGDEDEATRPAEDVTPAASASEADQVGADEIEREVDIFDNAAVRSLTDAATPAHDAVDEPAVEPALHSDLAIETSPIDGGHDGRETPPGPEDAFVTETMADLYLRQGHLESALDIFRRLVLQRPADERLRDRLRTVEDLLFGSTVEIATPVSSMTPLSVNPEAEAARQAPDEFSAVPAEAAEVESPGEEPAAAHVEPSAVPSSITASPSIREFLAGILARRAAAPVAAAPEAHRVDDSNQGEPVAESNQNVPVSPVVSMEAVVPAETLTESVDQPSNEVPESAFDEAREPDPNVTAATVLAEAFSDVEGTAMPLEGVPAHRAPNELSLDHVFRTPSKGVESSAFSFDRFFSEDSKDKKPAPAPEPQEKPTGAPDDIEQFNAWLSGLKKS